MEKTMRPKCKIEIEQEYCECGHSWREHEQPRGNISWDVCSFPCTKCDCTEFCDCHNCNRDFQQEAAERLR